MTRRDSAMVARRTRGGLSIFAGSSALPPILSASGGAGRGADAGQDSGGVFRSKAMAALGADSNLIAWHRLGPHG